MDIFIAILLFTLGIFIFIALRILSYEGWKSYKEE